jgi:hypothetical protein
VDDLRHAWALLGLRPGSSVDDVRRRYRALAKRWHPDRYANDPQGQADAAIQMRLLNSAHERLLVAGGNAAAAREPVAGPTGAWAPAVPYTGPLSRDALDRTIVGSGEGSWLRRSGYTSVRFAEQAAWGIAGAPVLWSYYQHDFRFLNRMFLPMAGMAMLATLWACYAIRCRVCGMRVYAMRLLNLPELDRQRFERCQECPYCFDDGTGQLGDTGRFDRRTEVRKARAFLTKAFLIVAVPLALFLGYAFVTGPLFPWHRGPRV